MTSHRGWKGPAQIPEGRLSFSPTGLDWGRSHIQTRQTLKDKRGWGRVGDQRVDLNISELSSRDEKCVFVVLQIPFRKLTQEGGLIAFLVISHNIKFKFHAKPDLETLHSGTLGGW